jgi:hypothetical protein
MQQIDLMSIIERLENDKNGSFVPDALDIINLIDYKYSSELKKIKKKLKETVNPEVLNFLICVLEQIPNSLDNNIIDILYDKVKYIENFISYKNRQKKSFCLFSPGGEYYEYILTLSYIKKYIKKQEKGIQEKVKYNNILRICSMKNP